MQTRQERVGLAGVLHLACAASTHRRMNSSADSGSALSVGDDVGDSDGEGDGSAGGSSVQPAAGQASKHSGKERGQGATFGCIRGPFRVETR